MPGKKIPQEHCPKSQFCAFKMFSPKLVRMVGIVSQVDPRMPESDDVQKKLLLGSLKKLKGANVNDTFVTIPKGAAALEELFVSSGFEMSSEEEGETTMYANLVGLSPDPQKKIM